MKTHPAKRRFAWAASIGLLCATNYAVPITYIGAGNSGANATTYTFTATGSGDVTAYFAGETAAYGSIIGMSVNGGSVGVTGLQNHSSAYGASLVLGGVNAGDIITFVMYASSTDGLGPATPAAADLTWYSNPALNSDGLNHIYSSDFAGDAFIPAGTYVGFEDLPGGGDFDFDDHQFVFSGPFRGDPNGVPDAGSTLAFLGLATVGAAALRRKTS